MQTARTHLLALIAALSLCARPASAADVENPNVRLAVGGVFIRVGAVGRD